MYVNLWDACWDKLSFYMKKLLSRPSFSETVAEYCPGMTPFPFSYSIPTVPLGLVSTCTLGVPAFSLLNPTFF